MKKSVFTLLAFILFSCGESKNKPLRITYKVHYPTPVTKEYVCDCANYTLQSSRGTEYLSGVKLHAFIFKTYIRIEGTVAPIEIISIERL